MTVILVLVTFIAFIGVEYFMHRRQAPVILVQESRGQNFVPRVVAQVVNGFKVQDNLKYHPGHTWALSESPTLVRVGIDDFASKLVGVAESVTLPQRGQWIRQGQKIVGLSKNGNVVEMVSPIEGTVSDVNDAVVRDPRLANIDPYGDGWLITVQSPDAKMNFRNLIGGTLAHRWMEETALRLSAMMPSMGMATAQDGGVAVSDIGAQVPAEKFVEMTKEFFLS